MSPQEFWLLLDHRTPPAEPEKVGTMPRALFDELVDQLHADDDQPGERLNAQSR